MREERCKSSAGVGAGQVPPAGGGHQHQRGTAGLGQPGGWRWGGGSSGKNARMERQGASPYCMQRNQVWLFKAVLHKLWITPTCSQLLDFMSADTYCYTSRSNETSTWCTDLKPSWLIKTQERSRLIIKGNDPCVSSGRDFPTFPENAAVFQEIEPHTARLLFVALYSQRWLRWCSQHAAYAGITDPSLLWTYPHGNEWQPHHVFHEKLFESYKAGERNTKNIALKNDGVKSIFFMG